MELNISIFVQLGIFTLLYFWLRYFLFTPLLKVLDERERRIEGAAKEAESLEAMNADYEREIDVRLSKANAEARQELTRLRDEGRNAEQRALDNAKRQAAVELDAADEKFSGMLAKASKDADVEAQALANLIIEDTLERGVAHA